MNIERASVPMEHNSPWDVQGAGLGLRRGLLPELLQAPDAPIDFMEVAPENWMNVGGRLGRQFREMTERYDFLCHGLSLSVGGPAPLDEQFIRDVGAFLKQHNIKAYSEHLSYCGGEHHLYDLMPIPFTEAAASHVAERIMRVQDILGQRLIIENVSAYLEPGKEMSEPEFVNLVLQKADCELLLDINNIYVNSVNHPSGGATDRTSAMERAKSYIEAMPGERIRYMHIAGHFEEADDLLVDTHGMEVKDDVWQLLQHTYACHGVVPTLLERDFNFPPLAELMDELNQIRRTQQQAAEHQEQGQQEQGQQEKAQQAGGDL